MSYALLWIEALLASLLFAAILITVGLRRKTRKAGVPLCAIGMLVPMFPLGGCLALAIALRVVSGVRNHGVIWAAALVLLYLSGVIGILIVGRRRNGAGVGRAFVWPMGRMAAAWVMVMSLMAMTLWNLDLRAQVEIQALRAEAGAMALGVTAPMIPDGANAAVVYKEANDQFKAATIPADKDVDYIALEPGSAVVEEYLRRQGKTLDLLRRAADMRECRVDFDYSKPDMGKMLEQWPHRGVVSLLDIAARAEASAGKMDLAVADARRRFAAADQVSASPALIGGLAAIAHQGRACETAARVLSSVRSKEELEEFGKLDERFLPRAFARSLRSEEALGLALFCDLVDGRGVYAAKVSVIGGHAMWLAYLGHEVIPAYRNVLRQAQGMVEKPFYETREEREELAGESRSGGLLMASAGPSLLPSMESLAKAQALRAAVAVAVAARRYHIEQGTYPENAEELVPRYMTALPKDPFDGHALRMKRAGDGLVIYSVGPDLRDDGGAIDPKVGRRDVGIRLAGR